MCLTVCILVVVVINATKDSFFGSIAKKQTSVGYETNKFPFQIPSQTAVETTTTS